MPVCNHSIRILDAFPQAWDLHNYDLFKVTDIDYTKAFHECHLSACFFSIDTNSRWCLWSKLYINITWRWCPGDLLNLWKWLLSSMGVLLDLGHQPCVMTIIVHCCWISSCEPIEEVCIYCRSSLERIVKRNWKNLSGGYPTISGMDSE